MTTHYDDRFRVADVLDARPRRLAFADARRARAAGAATLLGLLAAGVGEYLVVRPLAKERDDKRALRATIEAKNRENEAVLVGYEAFLREKADVDRRFESVTAAVPTDAELASVLDSIGSLAAESGMHLVNFTPDPPKKPGGAALEQRTARFLVRGGFDGLKRFVRLLGEYPRMLTVGSVTVKTSAQEGFTLEAAVAITCYFKATPQAAT